MWGGEREREGKQRKKEDTIISQVHVPAVGLQPNAPIYTDQTVIKHAPYIN